MPVLDHPGRLLRICRAIGARKSKKAVVRHTGPLLIIMLWNFYLQFFFREIL